ncbi:HK97 gp10 family phage protein [Clostridium ihumii]|uniref:HK97 gp10 family phage protein n=1 Tax=Clostridium ihumii TaxID=1470356 RepID=UPI000A7492F0|nr:HK97 gp10 family phage protein [Clostridium ihumii]
MSDINFKIEGIEDFESRLNQISRKVPDGQEKILRKAGNNLKKKCKEKTPTGKSSKHIKDQYKLSGISYDRDGMEIKLYNESSKLHLIEKGHKMVTKSGKEVGFVPGVKMVERSFKEVEQELPILIDGWMNKMLK